MNEAPFLLPVFCFVLKYILPFYHSLKFQHILSMSSVIDRGRVKNLTGNDQPVIDQAVRFDRQRVVLKEWIQIWSEDTVSGQEHRYLKDIAFVFIFLISGIKTQSSNFQRRIFLEKLLSRCNGEQLKFLFSVSVLFFHNQFHPGNSC